MLVKEGLSHGLGWKVKGGLSSLLGVRYVEEASIKNLVHSDSVMLRFVDLICMLRFAVDYPSSRSLLVMSYIPVTKFSLPDTSRSTNMELLNSDWPT